MGTKKISHQNQMDLIWPGDHFLDNIRLAIGQIGWVWLFVHTSTWPIAL